MGGSRKGPRARHVRERPPEPHEHREAPDNLRGEAQLVHGARVQLHPRRLRRRLHGELPAARPAEGERERAEVPQGRVVCDEPGAEEVRLGVQEAAAVELGERPGEARGAEGHVEEHGEAPGLGRGEVQREKAQGDAVWGGREDEDAARQAAACGRTRVTTGIWGRRGFSPSPLPKSCGHWGGAPRALQLNSAAASAPFARYGSNSADPGRNTAFEPKGARDGPPRHASESFEYLLAHGTCFDRLGRAGGGVELRRREGFALLL